MSRPIENCLRLESGDGSNVNVISPTGEFTFVGFPALDAHTISVTDGTSWFMLTSGIRVSAYERPDGGIEFFFSNPDPTPTSVVVTLQSDLWHSSQNGVITGRIGIMPVVAELFQATFAPLTSHGAMIFALLGAEARLVIRPAAADVQSMAFEAQDVSFEAMSTVSAMASPPPPTIIDVPAGRRPPEFSLGIYDDAGYTIPRPVRLGVPIISMVPAEPPTGAGALTGADLAYYTAGTGPTERIVYFRAICSQKLVSPTVRLMIYMPMGVDTVALPVEVTLTTWNWAGTLNSVGYDYRGSSVLPSGHSIFQVEDTINTVDGICYFNVYVPLHVQVALPLRMQVTASGMPIGVTAPGQSISSLGLGTAQVIDSEDAASLKTKITSNKSASTASTLPDASSLLKSDKTDASDTDK